VVRGKENHPKQLARRPEKRKRNLGFGRQAIILGILIELTEKFLVSMCGWPAFQQARSIHASGGVSDASYLPPLLKGRVASGGKTFLAGLTIKSGIDIENLCPCRDSRARGMICAHSVAIGLEVLKPHAATAPTQKRVEPAPMRPKTEELPVIEISLEGSLRHLEADVVFRYSQPNASNPAAEAPVLQELLGCGFESAGQKAVLRGEESVLRFFAAALPSWRKKWTIREGERFQHVTRDIVPIEPHFALREQGDGWLDFHVHFTAGREAVMTSQDLQRLLRGGTSSVRLSGDRIAVPDAAMLTDLEAVLADCDPVQQQGRYRVRPEQKGYLEACIAAWTGTEVASRMPGAKLGSLAKQLRPYQLDGARWLVDFAQRGEGGLLADEMGLGKTVQALAMMETVPGPHLVVCPSSLVWNWAKEAAHFLPALRVLPIQGASRAPAFAKIGEHDLIITSYPLLQRDIAHYRDRRFSTITLDEAQHIKNPDSLNAKAAAALKSDARFVLTGTPLENSIRDLWSLLDFVRPGYLGTRKDFQEKYEKPILDGERGPLWDRLVRRVRPAMLRRRKRDVLDDLPEKIEQVIEVDLSPAQKAAYTQLQIAARANVDALRENAPSARMQVLTALLRLRQACCDLRLLGVESPEPSAKLDVLVELLREAVDGGHRVLVFSQFTAMLDLIEPALNEAGITWCRLDGSTRDRASVVEKFQSDASISAFLISLKAGGVGLNLTAADTVIHFDPWWNPAVENQATDRAHRIGQKNIVTSIKLVARDTVENRVLELQNRKKSLLDGILDGGELGPALDADEIADLVG